MCYVYNQWYDISCATVYIGIIYNVARKHSLVLVWSQPPEGCPPLFHTHTHTLQVYNKTQKGKFASHVIYSITVAYACRVFLVLYWQQALCRLQAGKGAKVVRQLARLQNQSPARLRPQMTLH